MKKMIRKVITVLLLLAFIGVNMKIPAVSAATETKISIIHTNDVHSYVDVEPYVKGLANEIRLTNNNVAIVSAGDAFAGTPFASLSDGLDVAAVMNAVGYDLMTIGNHEFAMKSNMLKGIVDAVDFPILGKNAEANLLAEQPEIGDYVIKDYDGVKVAYLGLTTTYNNTGTSHGDYTVQIANELKAKAAAQGAEVFIAITHLGVTDPEASLRSTYLADNCPWLTAIIDGHCHSALPEGSMRNGVLIAQTGEYGGNIGLIELTVESGAVTSKTARLIKVKGNEESCGITPDPVVKEMIDQVNTRNADYLSEVMFVTPFDLIGKKETVRSQETNFGDIVADAYRAAGNVDVGFAASVTIRQDVSAGPVSREVLLSSLGSEQRLLEFAYTGQQIWDVMETALAAYPEVTNSFQQISGMKVQFDPTKEAGTRIYKITMKDGLEIDLGKTYSVIAREDMLSQFLTEEEQAQTTFTAHGSVYPKFIEYAQANSTSFPEKPENRIEIVDMDALKEAENNKQDPDSDQKEIEDKKENADQIKEKSGKKEDKKENAKTGVPINKSVNTGDSTNIFFWLIVASISAIGFIAARYRKKVSK